MRRRSAGHRRAARALGRAACAGTARRADPRRSAGSPPPGRPPPRPRRPASGKPRRGRWKGWNRRKACATLGRLWRFCRHHETKPPGELLARSPGGTQPQTSINASGSAPAPRLKPAPSHLAAQNRLARNPRSEEVGRIRGLATTFGLDLDRREVLDLRYQLLTLTAATVTEAHRQSAQRTVVIVHEFVSALTKADYRARNARDLGRFLETVFGYTGSIGPGVIAVPFRIDGLDALYFGKTETVI